MEKGKIAPEEQFLPLSTIFYSLMLDFYVKTGIRFSLRDKRFKITRVDCICQSGRALDGFGLAGYHEFSSDKIMFIPCLPFGPSLKLHHCELFFEQ